MGQYEGAGTQMITFQLTDPATVASVSGPQSFTGDVTCTTRGAGRYDISITSFRGPIGKAHTFPSILASSTTSVSAPAIFVSSAGGYVSNGDTLTFSIGINSGGVASTADWQCFVLAY